MVRSAKTISQEELEEAIKKIFEALRKAVLEEFIKKNEETAMGLSLWFVRVEEETKSLEEELKSLREETKSLQQETKFVPKGNEMTHGDGTDPV